MGGREQDLLEQKQRTVPGDLMSHPRPGAQPSLPVEEVQPQGPRTHSHACQAQEGQDPEMQNFSVFIFPHVHPPPKLGGARAHQALHVGPGSYYRRENLTSQSQPMSHGPLLSFGYIFLGLGSVTFVSN